MNYVLLILTGFNTFLLITILAILSKFIPQKTQFRAKTEEAGLVDIPNQPNYADARFQRPISSDIRFLRDD